MPSEKADLAARKFDADLGVVVFDQPLHLADRLARNDDAGHAGRALGQGEIELRQPMTISCDGTKRRSFSAAGIVQIDTVQIVARLFGRDCKLRAVDHSLQVGRWQFETVRHLACGEIRKIAFWQSLQREARAPRADRQHRAIAVAFQDDLRAIGQLAHDVVEHMRRHRRRSRGSRDICRQRFRHFEIEVGRFQRELAGLGPEQHVPENWNGVAAFDHAMDMAQRFQQLRTLDSDFHGAVFVPEQ